MEWRKLQSGEMKSNHTGQKWRNLDIGYRLRCSMTGASYPSMPLTCTRLPGTSQCGPSCTAPSGVGLWEVEIQVYTVGILSPSFTWSGQVACGQFEIPAARAERLMLDMVTQALTELTDIYNVRYTALQWYPMQKVTEIYNRVSEPYNFVTELEISSWNILYLLRSEVSYIGTGHVLP